MFFWILKKDLKLALSNKLHIGIVAIYPIIIIMVFGFTMRNYMNNNFGTFDNAKVFYYYDSATENMTEKFTDISEVLNEKLGVEFEEVTDYEKACSDVEKSKAYSVITIGSDQFSYFRSDFNETYGGDIVRSLFIELAENEDYSEVQIQEVPLNIKKVNADVYYTFAGLAIAILFISVIMANSFGRDHSAGTLDRIIMSKAGTSVIVLSKFVCGFILGILQIIIALGISTFIFKIKWENNFGMILLVLIVMQIFSLCFGLMTGSMIKNETTAFELCCYFVMLANYLGGSITPVYLLEKIPVLKYIIKISPVYWTNQSLANLYNGINDSKTRNCILILLGLSLVFITVTLIYMSSTSRAVSTKTHTITSSEKGDIQN